MTSGAEKPPARGRLPARLPGCLAGGSPERISRDCLARSGPLRSAKAPASLPPSGFSQEKRSQAASHGHETFHEAVSGLATCYRSGEPPLTAQPEAPRGLGFPAIPPKSTSCLFCSLKGAGGCWPPRTFQKVAGNFMGAWAPN